MITLSIMQLFRIISLVCLGAFLIILIKGLANSERKSPFIISIIWVLIPFIYIIARN